MSFDIRPEDSSMISFRLFFSSKRSPQFKIGKEKKSKRFCFQRTLKSRKASMKTWNSIGGYGYANSSEILPSFTQKTRAYLVWLIQKQACPELNIRIALFGWDVHIWYVQEKIGNLDFVPLIGRFLTPPKRQTSISSRWPRQGMT